MAAGRLGALTCSTLVPLTTLPSVEVHSGPMPWVPTWVPFTSYSFASGPLRTQE